jgi:prepilin-type N-terminal cleavage/methylation domain-containing protein
MPQAKTMKGFTLIEILVVVALIAILTAITFIAINPAKNFADTRNAQRSSDVTQILNAVTQYTSEQGHSLAGLGITEVCGVTVKHLATDNVTITAQLVPDYIVGIPSDPQPSGLGGYTICIDNASGGRVTVSAPSVEQTVVGTTKVISVKR